MYFVDRSKIEETLKYIDTLQKTFHQNEFKNTIENLGLERLIHVMIESIIDVGNMMIDGFIMRDPGSYEDIIDILIDEKVIPEADETAYKEVIKLRTDLVRDYASIDHNMLYKTILTHEKKLAHFSQHITKYLENEL